MAWVYCHVPPQFISFLTFVVDMIFLLRKQSASWPPMGTTIVITMWGTADRIPTCRESSDGPESIDTWSALVKLPFQPCWWGSQRLPQNTLADWWGASRRSNCGKSWPRWWHTRAWRWRSDPMGSWISVEDRSKGTYSEWVSLMSINVLAAGCRITDLSCTYLMHFFTNCCLNIDPLLFCYCRVLCRTSVRQQEPRHVPYDPKNTYLWQCKCTDFTYSPSFYLA